ncbi:MAG: glycosyl transferase family protein [Bryobacteraceae bacterium]
MQVLAWLDSRLADRMAWWVACLALYVLASGLDDLVLDILWLAGVGRRRAPLPAAPGREKRIAILVPLWREANVIGTMLEHNVCAIRYSNYEILAGVYANDEETRQAVEEAAARLSHVALVTVPHDGPTSKADCLNWIYQRLIERERGGAARAEIVMIHDAEDLIHPESLAQVNQWSEAAAMIQIPVLALATRLFELTHGVYCDDFAESHAKDLRVRSELGAFLPGCGVGTAFRREDLEKLAEQESNRIFDPLSLTEDYDNGVRLFRLGCRQLFLPLDGSAKEPVVTREYFPRAFRAAVRQRTRWITGNCLQSWQRHGWGRGLEGRWLQTWFFWRDRKSLWGSWAGIACNLLLLWAVCGRAAAAAASGAWALGEALAGIAWLGPVLAANFVLCGERILMRTWFSGRIYGAWFAAVAPLRMLWGNLINAAASFCAVWQFLVSVWTGKPLRWLKTEHCYPSLETLRAASSAPGAGAEAAWVHGAEEPGSPGRPAIVWPAGTSQCPSPVWVESRPLPPR